MTDPRIELRVIALAVLAMLLLATVVGCGGDAQTVGPETDMVAEQPEPSTEASEPAQEPPPVEQEDEPIEDLPMSGIGPDLWGLLETGFYRTMWQTAPGYETPMPAVGPHGEQVEIYINPTLAEALSQPGIVSWPHGSAIVKDAYTGGELDVVALMQKRGDIWYWAEYRADGSVVAEGADTPACANCHSAGEDYVRAFGLP